MKLLVGLGNPGEKYQKTRHNFGFLAIDAIIDEFNFIAKGEKFHGDFFTGEIVGEKICAIKPQTFMNLSGKSVLAIASFYKIPPQNIITFHDEIDIDFLQIRTKKGGGNAGHNGLKSIDNAIGKDYWRFRLGVARPKNLEFEIADYVLSKFSKDELEKVEEKCQEIAKNLPEFILANL